MNKEERERLLRYILETGRRKSIEKIKKLQWVDSFDPERYLSEAVSEMAAAFEKKEPPENVCVALLDVAARALAIRDIVFEERVNRVVKPSCCEE